MKTAIVVVLAMVMMAGVAMAQEQTQSIFPSLCPDVRVSVDCNCTETVLPGLWAVNIGGVGRCGELSVIPTGFLIYGYDGTTKFYTMSQMNKAKQVESCE